MIQFCICSFPNGWLADTYERNSRLTYIGKEVDFESDLGDFGVRKYDSDLGMFLSVDPKATDAPGWTPYRYGFNNPVNLIDPTGLWEADTDGNLIAEKGDNAQTLAEYQGIGYSEALKQMKDQGYTTTKIGKYDVLNLKIGDKVELDNVFTRSIKNSTSDLTMITGKAGTSKTGPTPEDNYNCWGSAHAGSQGKEIKVGVGIGKPSTFDNILKNDYETVSENKAIFGKTVLRYADTNNNTLHGSVFYGNNKAGEMSVYTKNGWQIKPQVLSNTELLKRIPQYGTIQGFDSTESGFYNPK